MESLLRLLKDRVAFAFFVSAASVAVILLIQALASEALEVVILGYSEPGFSWSFQMVMWIALVWGALLVARQYFQVQMARRHLLARYLPNDEDIVLQPEDLRPILIRVKRARFTDNAYLPNLIYHAIIQFQTSKSIEQTANVVNAQLSILHELLDGRYAMIRYITWLLPTLGFMGTVYGISVTVGVVGKTSVADPSLLQLVATNLAVAFDTTLVALVQSALLIWAMTVVQAKEEEILNVSGQFCITNLVNRIYRQG